jgi:cephalosporin hydroxylase
MASTSSLERKATLAGKQLTEAPVLLDGVLQVRDDSRANTTPGHVFADGLGQQPRDALVALLGHRPQFVPDLLIDLGADLDSAHRSTLA